MQDHRRHPTDSSYVTKSLQERHERLPPWMSPLPHDPDLRQADGSYRRMTLLEAMSWLMRRGLYWQALPLAEQYADEIVANLK